MGQMALLAEERSNQTRSREETPCISVRRDCCGDSARRIRTNCRGGNQFPPGQWYSIRRCGLRQNLPRRTRPTVTAHRGHLQPDALATSAFTTEPYWRSLDPSGWRNPAQGGPMSLESDTAGGASFDGTRSASRPTFRSIFLRTVPSSETHLVVGEIGSAPRQRRLLQLGL